jgi:8-oxo-dGTP pyrophosphatase MutT (NUDIX family)
MNPPDAKDIKHHFAGIFLITKSGKVVGQKRDNKPNIDNPGKVSAFGGTVEDDEDPLTGVLRELTEEETNLKVSRDDVQHLVDDVAWRKLTNEWEVRHFYYTTIDDGSLKNLEVYEGEGWAYIQSPDDPNIIDTWKPVVKKLFRDLNLLSSID